MVHRENNYIQQRKHCYLFVCIFSFLFISLFTQAFHHIHPYATSAIHISPESATDDIVITYDNIRNRPSSHFVRYIDEMKAHLVKLVVPTSGRHSWHPRSASWHKPSYYAFLFRYTLF